MAVLGDVSPASPLLQVGLFGDPGAAGRQPLNPQVKAQLLSEMPFVSEPVGDDISDLGDATPTGKARMYRRLGLGAVLGVALSYAAVKFVHGFRSSKGSKR